VRRDLWREVKEANVQSTQRKLLQQRARGATVLATLAMLVAAGCREEVGGDGYEPTPPSSAGKNAGGGLGGMMDAPTGGMMDQGGTPSDATTSGTGGKSHGGNAGKSGGGGTAGTAPTEGGAGGEPPLTASTCGNKIVEPGEQCDDGNTKSGDGCTADCLSDCEVCEKTFCTAVRSAAAGDNGWVEEDTRSPKNLYSGDEGCFGLVGTSMTGTAPAGTPYSQLCADVVDCVRREKCAQLLPIDTDNMGDFSPARTYSFMRCFCDLDIAAAGYANLCLDPATFKPGKCQREIQAASLFEPGDPKGSVFNAFVTGKKPLGDANLLLQVCDRTLCTEECLPGDTSGTVAQITADILSANNDAGESPVGDLIADAQRWATQTDFAFVNETTYLPYLHSRGLIFKAAVGRPADADGRVLESEVRQLVFGMGNDGRAANTEGGVKLVTLQLTGQEVQDFLNANHATTQVSGLSYSWSLPERGVVKEIRIGTTPIDKTATYTVTVNNTMVASIAAAKNVVTSDKSPEQQLVNYLKAQTQPIAPPTLNRVTVLN
jgi:cysteine-rich repeat protein